MTLDDSILARRRHVLQRAQERGNVSAACREAGMSRTLFSCGFARGLMAGELLDRC